MVPEHIEHRLTMPDGRTLAIAEWGDPAGLGLFSFHGTPGGRISCWEDPTIYARHGLRRFTLDRPGYGESTRQPGRSVADIVADVTFIADTLGVSSFAVTGGSGGGPHSLACAALMPDRVVRCMASVCLAPYGPDGLDGDAWLDGMTNGNVIEFRAAVAGESEMRPLAERLRATTLERLAEGRLDFEGDDYEMAEADLAQTAKHYERIYDHMTAGLAPGADGWIDDMLAFVGPWGFDPRDVRVPVYLSYGRADTLVPAAHGDWLAAAIPDARAVVTDAGHMGQDETIEIEFAWLAGH
jgi:pimeloyl-ACP methyl ester carboxylesterase